MNRSEMIRRIAAKHPELTRRDVELVVKVIFDTIAEALARGERVELRGFGSFSVRTRAPRIARNPKTGAQVFVPAKSTPHFKAGKELKALLNGGG
ncbi:MAG: integration host factor subunit beta [Zetaproteobacteria bacterium]|nr:MAG: integration host factor subunit beta [Zetaproteobacteria bacterium]